MDRIERLVRDQGFENFGFAELTTPFSIDLYDRWVDEGLHGEMEYLARHKVDKRAPRAHWARARSAIVVTQDYVPHPAPIEGWPLKNGARVAAYARGRDYHRFLHNKLRALCTILSAEFPGEEFVSFADAGPVLERDLAARAGLGWVGKNTCLIDRKRGSLFFLGEIYTSIELPIARLSSEDLEKDFCGTCTKCLDACPTGAIVAPRKLDARRCISYLTIETRDPAPVELRTKMGDWLFGCDICQTVCPWNVKAKGPETIASLEPSPSRADLVHDLKFILESPNRHLERVFAATPLARVNGLGLKKNALVVIANRKVHELKSEVERFDEHPRLGDLAKWALASLNSASAP
ncbi:MAG: tRNA epoxyqueuosine(34) reductase QueG [Bdellovibrionota bacterium]